MRNRWMSLVIAGLALSLPLSAMAQAEDQDIEPEWEDGGVIEAGAYESPQFGYEVTWDGRWLIDEDLDPDDAVTTDDPGGDVLHLALDDTDTWAIIGGFDVESLDLDDPDNALAEWADVVENADDADIYEVLYAEVSDDLATIVVYTDAFGNEEVVFRTAHLVNRGDVLVVATYGSTAEEFTANDADARDIEVEGDDAFEELTLGDLADISEQARAIADGDSSAGDDDTDAEGDTGYLDAVAEDVATRQDELSRVYEIGESTSPTDEEIDEFVDILTSWASATDTADELYPGMEYADLHELYVDYLTELEDASAAFTDAALSEANSTEQMEYIDAFVGHIEEADDLATDLVREIEDAGGDPDGADPDDDGSDGDDGDEFDPGFL